MKAENLLFIYLFIFIFNFSIGLEPQIMGLPTPLIKACGMRGGLVATYELKSWGMRTVEVI